MIGTLRAKRLLTGFWFKLGNPANVFRRKGFVTVVVEIVKLAQTTKEVAWSMSVDQFHNQFLALEFTKMMFREKILI